MIRSIDLFTKIGPNLSKLINVEFTFISGIDGIPIRGLRYSGYEYVVDNKKCRFRCFEIPTPSIGRADVEINGVVRKLTSSDLLDIMRVLKTGKKQDIIQKIRDMSCVGIASLLWMEYIDNAKLKDLLGEDDAQYANPNVPVLVDAESYIWETFLNPEYWIMKG